MAIQVERDDFDAQEGFRYYVGFKPNALESEEPFARVPVHVVLSVCENGDLADVTFELPKPCRNDKALEYIQQQAEARYVNPLVYVVHPGRSGDAVIKAAGNLEMDLAGRIIGMEIQWRPALSAQA